MIIANLRGGLGNQMFQYAFARRLALAAGAPLGLNIAGYDHAKRTETPRQFRLNGFRIQAEIINRPLLTRLAPVMHRLPRFLTWLPDRFGWQRWIAEKTFAFDPDAVRGGANVCLSGYWQSARYFAPCAAELRADFTLVEPLSPARQKLAAQMGPNAVSVHVRRGDYVVHPQAQALHGTCAPEWYATVMTHMKAQFADTRFFIFSDDPVWARAHLTVDENTVFADPQPDGRDFEDMHLMSRCRHQIIANSSFSWWGAWLNPSTDKKVIAPARWFKDSRIDTKDLLPDDWIKM